MKLDENELNMAKMLIETMTGKFVAVDATGPSNVINLMELKLVMQPTFETQKFINRRLLDWSLQKTKKLCYNLPYTGGKKHEYKVYT